MSTALPTPSPMGHDCGRGAETRDFSREVMGVKKFAHTGTSPQRLRPTVTT
jgi:hypothetical protein